MSDRSLSAVVLPLPRPYRPARADSGIWSRIRAAWRRRRSRQLLTELDAHLLRDIGVTLAEAEVEANKPFWMA